VQGTGRILRDLGVRLLNDLFISLARTEEEGRELISVQCP